MSSAQNMLSGSLIPVPAGIPGIVHTIKNGNEMMVMNASSHLCVHAPANIKGTLCIHLHNAEQFLCEVILEEHSNVTLIVLEQSSKKISIAQRTKISDGAHLHLLAISLGSDVEHVLESVVTGANGVSSIDWLSYAKDTDQQTLSVRNIFQERLGGGEVTMRSVAEQKGKVDLSGMIDIGEHGAGTHTYLTQQVLMLDATAKVDASPALEIKTNDVKASHSASVSRVTPEDLYYFSSRGIDPNKARGLLVKGFLGELVQRIEYSEAADAITKAIEEKYAEK